MVVKHGSVEVGPPAAPGEGPPRRSTVHPESLVFSPASAPNITGLAGILANCVAKFGDQKALGWRETIRVVQEEKDVVKTVEGKEVVEKKSWSYFELSPYKYWTYSEFAAAVKDIGSALVATGHTKDTIFNIYAATSHIWQTIANGCASQGITFATAYDSLGKEGLEHSINEPFVYGMFTNAPLLSTIAAVINKTPSLKVVVYDGKVEEASAEAIETIKAANGGVRVFTLKEFMLLGKEKPAEPNWGTSESTACIMYTSGSTGTPKGVIISNANIVAAIGAVEALLPDYIKPGEAYIAYLPLAHIMEFAVEYAFVLLKKGFETDLKGTFQRMCMLFVGALIGYGTVKTLTDASVRNCYGDIHEFRPTILVGVPAVYELIRKGIMAKVKAAGGLKQSLFHGAVAAKKFSGKNGILTGIADAVVFKAIKEGTGGRLKVALSGGAQISQETQEFLSIALVTLVQGYGMTETCALCAILPPAIARLGAVGVPVPSVEVKLVDFPEANYLTSSTPSQGEIYLRGPSVSKGYYKRDDLTKEAFTDDGWLKTGDIGQWNADGTLSLIDRCKNLVKLSGGEYIAIERLESIYRSSNYVANICVYADVQSSRAMAVIFPHESNVKLLVKEKSLANGAQDLNAICADDGVRDAVLKDLNAVGRKAGFKPLESIQTVVLTPDEWTPQNGLLTAAAKLQRKAIHNKYQSQIDAVYP